MTPIIFVSFLFSLAWVDYRHSVRRPSHSHAEDETRWLPQWIHRLVYRVQPYHTKQRKLMRLEAEEAFEMRGWAVLFLGVLGALLSWAGWRLAAMGCSLLSGKH